MNAPDYTALMGHLRSRLAVEIIVGWVGQKQNFSKTILHYTLLTW